MHNDYRTCVYHNDSSISKIYSNFITNVCFHTHTHKLIDSILSVFAKLFLTILTHCHCPGADVVVYQANTLPYGAGIPHGHQLKSPLLHF